MTQIDSAAGRWLVAIDGGGSKIAGAITKQDKDFAYFPKGPAIIRHSAQGTGSAATASWNIARPNLIRMFERLLNEASVNPENISNVVLMLAGAGRPNDIERITESLTKNSAFGLCTRVTVTSDIQPLLFEARDSLRDSTSIVVIAGTGSLVAALDANENIVRAGGWGPVLGDEGSGWGLALAFLKTICSGIDGDRDAEQAAEGRQLLNGFLADKQLPTNPQTLNSAIIALASDRHLASQLAPRILELATQPNMTAISQLVNQQFALLADQVQMVHSRLAIANRQWRLCLSGGLASNDERFQNLFSAELTRRVIAPASVVVLDPLDAALRFAAKVA